MSARDIGRELLRLGPSELLGLAASRLCSIDHIYVLRYNLGRLPLQETNRKGGGQLRLLDEADIACLEAELDQKRVASSERRHIATRVLFYKSGLRHCYGLREADRILYLQWLIFPEEAGLLMRHYGNRYLPIREKEVMIENAFTHPMARGRGYYPAYSLELMRLAAARGARSAVAYVKKSNLPSLTQLIAMGFKATALLRDYRCMGRAWISRPNSW